MTSQTPRQQISLIDRKISQIHFALETLERINPYSAESWQAAWDKHPELRAQETELYRQRGTLQIERDTADARMAAAARRRENAKLRRKTCSTCGQQIAA